VQWLALFVYDISNFDRPNNVLGVCNFAKECNFTMVELATPITAYLIAHYYVCLHVIQRCVWNI
jgi:hypothetical protein